ncbi:hypothetical protein [Mesoplasma melaleucae]|uniref:hypothetical protein n=1 Tax=Mesoplasma melaleucae TaxID=81459 RepID=UPI0004836797|nr:hypothetical protein [Mesoplasma melaleucae]
MNTFLSSTFDGVIKGLASGIDPDDGILDFLNRIGIGSEQLGGVASGLVSSILTGIDIDNFFKTLVDQLVESFNNLKEWSFINDKLKEQINNIITKVESFRVTIASIVDSEASYTNKFLGYLVNQILEN